jgi:8-oxo-dGTP pyrophosphatase MutT (NUDIX family)
MEMIFWHYRKKYLINRDALLYNSLMSYLEHIENCNHYNPDLYIPFSIDRQILGWVDNDFAKYLNRWDEVFSISGSEIALNPHISTPEQRSKAIAPILESLHKKNVIDSWVGELYAVNQVYGEEPLLLMERAAVSFFGIRGYGVHLNGLVEKPDGTYIWIARRTKDKPFWPGMLDQMVAGGQPAGIGRLENLIKECAEEANIPKLIASKAEFVSTLHYRGTSTRGMNVDTLFNYDLFLPEDFIPENTDGEVDEFILMPLEEMAKITETTGEFKDNCNLVNIDLLLRRGLIKESHPDYTAICKKLYAPAS